MRLSLSFFDPSQNVPISARYLISRSMCGFTWQRCIVCQFLCSLLLLGFGKSPDALAEDPATGSADLQGLSIDVPLSQSNVEAGLHLVYVQEADPILSEQVSFLNDLIRFAEPVKVLTEVDEGPLFDPVSQEIWFPGSFADMIESYFVEEQAPVADIYFHTLLHEVGHVLFSHYDLPLLAREEDAADALASVLLLEYVDDGARIALNAADMFGLESEESEWFYQSDFWSEHSLDIQRYYATLCHVYGSDPDNQKSLINEDYGLSAERAEVCIEEYERIRAGWLSVLKPYLKR